MDIFAVGIYKKGKNIVGFRMLAVCNGEAKEVKDIDYSTVLKTVKANPSAIKNLKIENNQLKGKNGSLDRYGIIGKSQALVILNEVYDNNDKFLGYFCSDALANTKNITENEAIAFADKLGIANGKVVNDSSTGKRRISSIDGTYDILKKNTGNTNKDTDNDKKPAVDGKYRDAIILIDIMSSHKDYPKSFAKKVADTIQKYGKCSDKQLDILKKQYEEWTLASKENNKPEVKSEVKPDTTVKEEDKPKLTLDRKKAEPIVIGKPEMDMDDVLVYQIMKNGNVYVTGIRLDEKTNARIEIDTLVIPDKTVLNGKEYKITGIKMGAFIGSNIKQVKTGKNITDIGQEAFMNCNKLEAADFSQSLHSHIPMKLFNNCTSLSQVNVGNYVQRIHESAFNNCKKLEYIELPECTDTIARTAFMDCLRLKSCKHSAKYINDSAFRNCEVLDDINLDTVIQIGAYAFRHTGFKHLVIPGNVTSLGTKAFADCMMLEDIIIEEGVQELGEYCFAKPSEAEAIRTFGRKVPRVDTKEITTPKSIISVLTGAFRHVDLVKVWTGSVCESHCIGFNVRHVCIDKIDTDNSTKVRIKAGLLGVNPIETLHNLLSNEREKASNPDFELNQSKLVNVPFSDSQMQFFGISKTTEVIEPHIKFKAAVNYLQDVSSLFQAPLTNGVLRLQDTFYVNAQELFNDGCNRIYKVSYTIMDTLECGSYMMVIMNNNLRYMCECTLATDIVLDSCTEENKEIPVNTYLHAGDTLGKQATISGHTGILEVEGSYRGINVGEMLLTRIKQHGITIETTKRDSMLYIPACNTVLNLHDGRIWDRPGVISSSTKDCINLINIISYDEMKDTLKSNKKASYNESKLFDELCKLSDREVKSRTKNIATIEDEKEAQLFQVSKHFRKIIDNARVNEVDITPNLISYEVFNELSRSYWMVHKDLAWLNSAGTKSLNKVNEYTIGKYKLIEYKSNQIVKFSNPYMNGKKGAYIFTLMSNNNILGVYASRYSMDILVKKLYGLTDMSGLPEGYEIPTLMTSAENFDKVHPSLFYDFYDVLQSKNGWSFSSAYGAYSYGVSFHISMYKPTGIFYLTMQKMTVTTDKNKEKQTKAYRVIPLLPIGNMDRALMVATTTNTNARDSQLLKELLGIMNIEEYYDSHMRLDYNSNKEEMINFKNNYIKARELVINRVKDVSQYKKLIDDRAVYMLGTLHSGVLQREFSDGSFEDEIDDLEVDIDMSDINDDTDIDDLDTDIDLEVDEEIDIDLDDEDDNNDDSDLSFDDFFETAKSMGITDENQARAMYISFLNQQ